MVSPTIIDDRKPLHCSAIAFDFGLLLGVLARLLLNPLVALRLSGSGLAKRLQAGGNQEGQQHQNGNLFKTTYPLLFNLLTLYLRANSF